MMSERLFWRVYGFSGTVSILMSLAYFHLALQASHLSYEEAAGLSSLMAVPINWLIGEQATWDRTAISRGQRAARYYTVYGVGLLIQLAIVHFVGHVLDFDGRVSDLLGVMGSVCWTGPMNRLWTWRQDVVSLLQANQKRG